MERPTRDFVLMQSAFLWAQRSTCSRLHVGCVIERDGRILVQGYNGAPAGLQHCNHDCTCDFFQENELGITPINHTPKCLTQQPCTRAVHAEQNAIAFAARHGVGLEGASAWVTNQPCMPCAQSLINAGISAVHFLDPYRLTLGTQMLQEAGVTVVDRGRENPEWHDRIMR